MGGGLMQLVAYGAQDIYLTGNPQITFFKVVYRRHTNFSMETIRQTITGTPSDNGSSTVTISRNGDLVSRIYVTLNGTGVNKGSNIVSEVELEIGGQRIDLHYEEWMNIWNELSTPESKSLALKAMQGDIGNDDHDGGVGNVQVPLQFWFCRNPGLALPLIALQYHEVILKFTWGGDHGGDVTNSQVWCDYIYLDTDERRRFAQVSHEYLIEQVQRDTPTAASGDTKLNFNHPVKELIWTSNLDYKDAKLVFNGHDRFAPQEEEYFQLRQPYEYHTAVPLQNLPNGALESVRPDGAATQFNGHTETGIYTGVDTVSTSGQIKITKTKVEFQGDDSPEFNSNYAAGFNLVITAQEPNNDDEYYPWIPAQITAPSRANKNYYVTVAPGASNVTVDGTSHKVTFITTDYPRSRDGEYIRANGTVQGTYKILITGKTTHLHNQARTSKMTDKINVYSFGLKPEEHQPSGTCNFSRIDNAKLNFKQIPHSGTMSIYAINYNVLRIMSGMGGLAYSN